MSLFYSLIRTIRITVIFPHLLHVQHNSRFSKQKIQTGTKNQCQNKNKAFTHYVFSLVDHPTPDATRFKNIERERERFLWIWVSRLNKHHHHIGLQQRSKKRSVPFKQFLFEFHFNGDLKNVRSGAPASSIASGILI